MVWFFKNKLQRKKNILQKKYLNTHPDNDLRFAVGEDKKNIIEVQRRLQKLELFCAILLLTAVLFLALMYINYSE
ncbi:hypothetical protein FD46_GL001247 [Liquorilactobacillus oeni DSM 19972]|uniref:Uncharacterized protein n=1 Tax=Liquorilactobacillus oeni DSM 19972 TaxID=1423777 RepID=A0A0R1MG43_9LACO|nr:hypothetical protein FD46_GL001247 [Liquorilactobacillus oeni DSM 19972]